MVFSAKQLLILISKREIMIHPFINDNLTKAGYFFTLSNKVKIPIHTDCIDSREVLQFSEWEISEEGYELKPGKFALFLTNETISLNEKYVCFLSTRSTIAQMGLNVSQSSIFVEPNTNNKFILEISNNGVLPVKLFAGIKIIKGIFMSIS